MGAVLQQPRSTSKAHLRGLPMRAQDGRGSLAMEPSPGPGSEDRAPTHSRLDAIRGRWRDPAERHHPRFLLPLTADSSPVAAVPLTLGLPAPGLWHRRWSYAVLLPATSGESYSMRVPRRPDELAYGGQSSLSPRLSQASVPTSRQRLCEPANIYGQWRA